MSVFNVGDRVKLKSGMCAVNLNHISEYVVECAVVGGVKLEGVSLSYAANIFTLIEKAEYKKELMSTVQALMSILLDEDDLQYRTSENSVWCDVMRNPETITIHTLKNWDWRIKPKTVVVNGIEVPEPLSEKPDSGAVSSLKVSVNGKKPTEMFFKTESDAMSYKEAMLLGFEKKYMRC